MADPAQKPAFASKFLFASLLRAKTCSQLNKDISMTKWPPSAPP